MIRIEPPTEGSGEMLAVPPVLCVYPMLVQLQKHQSAEQK